MTFQLLTVAAALFLGGAVQSIGGFGAMLVAVPLVTMVLPLQTAVPLLATLGVPITTIVFYNNRHGFDWREVAKISLGAMVGIPLGLWALRHVEPVFIMRGLGSLLIAYSLYALVIEPLRLTTPQHARQSHPILSLMAGFASGLFSGACSTGGPPLIVYGTWLRWPREQFKAIVQGVFVINGALAILGHFIAGNFKLTMLPFGAVALPGILLGLWAGHRIDRFVNPKQFRRIVLIMLLLMGISLMARQGEDRAEDTAPTATNHSSEVYTPDYVG